MAAVGEGETVWKEGDRIGGAWHGGHDGTYTIPSRSSNSLFFDETILMRDALDRYLRGMQEGLLPDVR